MSSEYIQYVVARFLSRYFPRRTSYRIAIAVCNGFHRRDHRGRAAVQANLRQILTHRRTPFTDTDIDRLTKETFHNFGKYLVDFFRFTNVDMAMVERYITLENRVHLEEAVSRKKGTLLLTAHLGNWEIAGAVVSAMGHPMNVVVQPQQDRRTNTLFQATRAMRGFNVIPRGRAAQGILAALKRDELVALLADRDYGPRTDTFEFFGAPARLPTGPAKLCVKTGTPVMPGFLLRKPDDTFTLRCHPPIIPDVTTSVVEVQCRIAAILEQEIAAAPSQWFIFDEFWRN
jgi:KDO2-lipid IV(A) lauroyltransferase